MVSNLELTGLGKIIHSLRGKNVKHPPKNTCPFTKHQKLCLDVGISTFRLPDSTLVFSSPLVLHRKYLSFDIMKWSWQKVPFQSSLEIKKGVGLTTGDVWIHNVVKIKRQWSNLQQRASYNWLQILIYTVSAHKMKAADGMEFLPPAPTIFLLLLPFY